MPATTSKHPLSLRRSPRHQPSPLADALTYHDTGGRCVLGFLDAPSLGAVAAVCRSLRALAMVDTV